MALSSGITGLNLQQRTRQLLHKYQYYQEKDNTDVNGDGDGDGERVFYSNKLSLSLSLSLSSQEKMQFSFLAMREAQAIRSYFSNLESSISTLSTLPAAAAAAEGHQDIPQQSNLSSVRNPLAHPVPVYLRGPSSVPTPREPFVFLHSEKTGGTLVTTFCVASM